MEATLIILGIILIILIFQRWFWVVVFFLATMASLFAMIASIIYFQIFGAIGFLILFIISRSILSVIVEE
jgi:hypothetical protein